MSLANLEFDNFTAIHSALRKMNSFDKDTWVTIDLEKGETGAYILPSPDAHIDLLNENINEFLYTCENIGVTHLVYNYPNSSLRLNDLLEKVKSLEDQQCDILRFETIETAWFDFATLVSTIHSILIEELKEDIYECECGGDLLNDCGFSEHIDYLVLHSAELMKLSSISKSTFKDNDKTMH